ncbi:MAG: hypothetical protein GY772_03560 [bacterium]|nr:hypothetical protein [Deltaproteobacteria bacterium]MCP4239618.1 hypothetical protein [bacterium]
MLRAGHRRVSRSRCGPSLLFDEPALGEAWLLAEIAAHSTTYGEFREQAKTGDLRVVAECRHRG